LVFKQKTSDHIHGLVKAIQYYQNNGWHLNGFDV
jgi:hypothetical protein